MNTRRSVSRSRRTGRSVGVFAGSPGVPGAAFLTILAVFTLLTGCSVVFTAGVSGRVVDAEAFADDPTTGGINGVKVYLYLRERDRSSDLERFETEGLLPDEDGGDGFYLEAVTATIGGNAGSFSFPTIYWNDLLPSYGRSGDRRDIFLLLYHPEYGPVEHAAAIVSDASNTLAPVEITWLYQKATIAGRVERFGTTAGVPGVTARVYLATAWSEADGYTYATEPDEEVTSSGNGDFSVDITYLRALDESAGGGSALVTFSVDDYAVTVADDADLANDRDVDGDGANDVYYLTPVIAARETTDLATISIRQISFTEQLDGRVGVDLDADGNVDSGTNGAVIALYINRSVPPGAADPPDFTTTSANLIVDTNVEAGWFSFSDVSWDDGGYTGAQSSVTCYLDVDADGDGTVDPALDNVPVTVYSNTDNTVQIVQ